MAKSRLNLARPRRSRFFGHRSPRARRLLWLALIAGVFVTFFYGPCLVVAPAMKDTLLIGDVVAVNKFAYGYSRYSCPFELCHFRGRIWFTAPHRGDIVLVHLGGGTGDRLLRVIGMPGDNVAIKAGRLVINGSEVARRPAGDFAEIFQRQGPLGVWPRCANAPVGEGGICVKQRWVEHLPGGGAHDILSIGAAAGGYGRDMAPLQVPEGYYFLLGDNRDNSRDSRVAPAAGGTGLVPQSALIGRASRILISTAGGSVAEFWRWRWRRFLRAIH